MNHKFIALLLALLLLSGCTPAPVESKPSAAPIQQASPAPMSALWDKESLCAAFIKLWEEASGPTPGEYIPENMFSQNDPWQLFGTTLSEREWLPAMAEDIKLQLTQMLQSTAEELITSPQAPSFTWEIQINAPSWQLLLTLLQASTSIDEAAAYMKASLALSVTARELPDGSYALLLALDPLPYKQALALPDSSAQAIMRRSFSYSYSLTVFDENATEQDEYIQPPAEGNLASGISWPLSQHTRLRKTWYADRDGGQRKHTGTDIWAPEDADIYSCTDGTVSYIGYSDGTGYAVIVTDQYGYEFHYYHMVRETTFLNEGDAVKAGALIGHVGNTGNSSLDHLHLTIVAPNGLYINPYPYLKAVEP